MAPAAAPAPAPAPSLVLASSSRWRRELLERLRRPFEVVVPDVEETPWPGEAPQALAQRLAIAKARAVAARRPDAVVIGSDQVADLAGQPLGKPGGHARAVAQLRTLSGREVVFHTAVAVCRAAGGFERVRCVPVHVRFRELGDAEIERYLRLDEPYGCAGSARSEALGIALLDAARSDDPTALIGLPLIATCALLREAGSDPLAAPGAGPDGDLE
jgi:septum formation protein